MLLLYSAEFECIISVADSSSTVGGIGILMVGRVEVIPPKFIAPVIIVGGSPNFTAEPFLVRPARVVPESKEELLAFPGELLMRCNDVTDMF